MSVADAYLFVILNWAEKMQIDTSAHPHLTAFFARMKEQEGVKRALAKEAA